MWREILISVIVVVLLGVGIAIVSANKDNNVKNDQLEVEPEAIDISEISEELVDDDCIDEWKDYEAYKKELEEASSNFGEEKTHYLVKSVDNYINVYYIDNAANNILYKETKISTDYLSEADKNNLKNGVDVYGVENLNKLLEDYE